MNKKVIIKNLDDFLSSHNPLNEENHIVYLMVEIRKALDCDKNGNKKERYKVLKFYCDWIVHIRKDRVSRRIKRIMRDIYKDIKSGNILVEKELEIAKFLYFNELKKDLVVFFKTNKLNKDLLIKENCWIKFIKLLAKNLSEQPIVNPTENIKKFKFFPAAEGCCLGCIEFKVQATKYKTYKFGNFYG